MGTLDQGNTVTGCGTLDTGVEGGGGDSVIRVEENITESVNFSEPQGGIQQTISESVTVQVT